MILAIYGAGGLAREIFDAVQSRRETCWEEIIFIDDYGKNAFLYDHRVISFSKFENCYDIVDVEFIIGVGEPSTRALLFSKIQRKGFSFVTILHATAVISESSIIGKGVYVGPFSFISSNTIISDNVIIQPHAMVGHDTQIGHSSVISTNAVLAGNCTVGERTFIALSVSVEQKTNIGDDSIIGMASCVNKDIPSNVIAMGYPVRILKQNETKKVF